MSSHMIVWAIAAVSTACVIIRPFGWPEAIWPASGATILVALRLLPLADAWTGIAKGIDVYLFLVGMMLLAEVARMEGLFDWLAAVAIRFARGSPHRLFLLLYVVGTIVTVLLSNDATAVVLTPAVAVAVKTAGAERPLPYLLICAFVANAASFVLPISNPANLVIYGTHMPPLPIWLPRYALPSALSILATYAVLRWTQREALNQSIRREVEVPTLSLGGKTAGVGVGATAIALMASSALDCQLGLSTAIAGAATAVVVLVIGYKSPRAVLTGVAWSILPLVAALFVLVEALDRSGFTGAIGRGLRDLAAHAPVAGPWTAGIVVALTTNVMNNLPAGLIAGSAVQSAHAADNVTSAILIGVDVGPNLSVTGSLATILWLTALRRAGHTVSNRVFLKLGCLVMPPALLLAIAGTYASR